MITYQLTPPNVHRSNADEWSIRTWKDHFISGLSNTHPNFPLYLWDRLINQANISLNLLRKSRIHPKLLSYQELEGVLDYNKTPLFPPGSQVMIHEKDEKRHTWGPRILHGWYIGPSLYKYRCVKVYIPKQSLREFQITSPSFHILEFNQNCHLTKRFYKKQKIWSIPFKNSPKRKILLPINQHWNP